MQLVTSGGTAQLTQKDNYVDGDKTATIPEGFKVSDTDYTIDTGLVVIAPDESEFVWVPVENAITGQESDGNVNKAMAVKQSDGSYRGLLYNFNDTGDDTTSEIISGCTTTNFTSNSGSREPAVLNGTTSDGIKIDDAAKGITLPELQSEYKKMIESVEKYGGFYVGRYETSYDESNVASKKGEEPMSAADDSNQMWYGMYEKQKNYAKNVKFEENSEKTLEDIVGSSMIWGSQYDAMLNWILKGTDASKVTANSEQHEKAKTGLTLRDVMNNIYDLGNNLSVWTLEAGNSNGRFIRGGNYFVSYSPSNRSLNDPNKPSVGNGSRLTLYIK